MIRWLRCPVVGSGAETNPYRPAITPVYRREAGVDPRTGEMRYECVEAYPHEGYSAVYVPDDPPYQFCIIRIEVEERVRFHAEHVLEEFRGREGKERFTRLCEEFPRLRWRWRDQPEYSSEGPDPVETRYMQNDEWTVNGLLAGKLATTQTTTYGYKSHAGAGDVTVYWSWDIIKRNSTGSETVIGSKVAQVSRSVDGSGIQSATWDCPQTSLVSTDAIRASGFQKIGTAAWTARGYGTAEAWISEQLGATILSAATWTIYSWTIREYDPEADWVSIRLYWGTTTYNTRIENFTWTSGVAYTQTISEILGMVDSIAAPGTLHKTVTESLGMVDSIAAPGTLHLSFSDSLGLVDSITALRRVYLTITETLGLVDSIAAKSALKVAITEVLAMLDSLVPVKIKLIVITEILGLKDLIETRRHRAKIGDLPDHTITGGA